MTANISTHKTGWTDEDRLLFHLVRRTVRRSCRETAYSTGDVGALRGLSKEMDSRFRGNDRIFILLRNLIEKPLNWDMLLERAIDGGVAPLAYTWLRGADHAPAPVLERLRDLYFLTGAENMQYLACARRLFTACADAGIGVTALRGIAFMETLYRDAALRPVSDIDILAHPADLPRLEKILRSLGYQRVDGHSHQWTGAWAVFDIHTDLVGAERIASRRRAVSIDMDEIWDASAPAVIAGMEVRTLSWTDTLLTCCLHAIKHSCDRILWFADLAMLIETQPEIRWDEVVERAQRFKIAKPAYYALSYAKHTLDARIPDEIIGALRPDRTGWLERRCMDRVLRGEPAGRFGEVFTLFMMNRIQDRLAFIVETCFPEPEVIAQSYGADAAGRFPARSRRLWDVAEMAFGVMKYGITGSKTESRNVRLS